MARDVARYESPEAWRAEAAARFGSDNPKVWKFVCPICGGVQGFEDFQRADPDLSDHQIANQVYYSCVGRLLPKTERAFGGDPTPDTHCDYTLGGLFRVPGAYVIDDEGKERPVFDFAPSQAPVPPC